MNKDLIHELVNKAKNTYSKNNGLLDELIHDIFSGKAAIKNNHHISNSKDEQTYDDYSLQASNINNKGLEAQITLIINEFGEIDGKGAIEKALTEKPE